MKKLMIAAFAALAAFGAMAWSPLGIGIVVYLVLFVFNTVKKKNK